MLPWKFTRFTWQSNGDFKILSKATRWHWNLQVLQSLNMITKNNSWGGKLGCHSLHFFLSINNFPALDTSRSTTINLLRSLKYLTSYSKAWAINLKALFRQNLINLDAVYDFLIFQLPSQSPTSTFLSSMKDVDIKCWPVWGMSISKFVKNFVKMML